MRVSILRFESLTLRIEKLPKGSFSHFNNLIRKQVVEFTQELVKEYIQNWVGVSAISRENNTPGFFRLYFLNQKSAFKSFVFLDGWQEWLLEHKMVLSIVKENDNEYTLFTFIRKQDQNS